MKKSVFIFFILLSGVGFAQSKLIPVLKQGSKLHYSIITPNGVFPLTLKLDSLASDYVKMGWMMDDQSTGSWIMKKQSLESATSGYWSEPQPGVSQELAGNQTVVVMSKTQWNSLQKEKKLSFDMKNYIVKTATEKQQFKLGDKLVDALFLEAEDGTSRIWLLNNPSFPLLLKMEGNVAGPDVELQSVD